jgi:hypothetical protein
MFMHCLHHIHFILLFPFPASSPFPLVPNPYPLQNLFFPPALQFGRRKHIKEKKRNMVLMLVSDKDSYTGSFLSHMDYNSSWSISTISLHYSLVPFPCWPQTV